MPKCARPGCGGSVLIEDNEPKCMLCSRSGDEVLPQVRTSAFNIRVIKYLARGLPVVVYEATEPAEIYTIASY